ncbi:hypothetical protein UFOVP71_186 [uncultured Caudovirales phage]|uniref:Uncharacterized protein n=1 Tax=uncultured Caudovirales phage TaxID=2100421 RepID=A0A6J5T9N2_9CAUD|nr:hypothetical protein UFOVP71_186 [uncultured Caudovirales phage]
MNLEQLIEDLDQNYGNPRAPKQYHRIQLAVAELRRLQSVEVEYNNLKNKQTN